MKIDRNWERRTERNPETQKECAWRSEGGKRLREGQMDTEREEKVRWKQES